MNVNPFSYLIEKLKGKVDKHTSFVGATDIDTVKAQGVYPLSQYNSNLPEIGSNKDWSTLYVSGNENDVASQLFVSRGNRMFFRRCVLGTWGSWNELALKSDYGAKTVVETRHDIVFNNSDTSNWIDPPSAISSKTIYAMVFSSLDGGGGIITREAGGSNRFAIRWSVAITATLNARLVWFYTD